MVSLTVFVPAYNEEKTLEQSLNRLMELKIISQIIFVDDGPSDNTLPFFIYRIFNLLPWKYKLWSPFILFCLLFFTVVDQN